MTARMRTPSPDARRLHIAAVEENHGSSLEENFSVDRRDELWGEGGSVVDKSLLHFLVQRRRAKVEDSRFIAFLCKGVNYFSPHGELGSGPRPLRRALGDEQLDVCETWQCTRHPSPSVRAHTLALFLASANLCLVWLFDRR